MTEENKNTARCLRCRKKVEIADPKTTVLKNNLEAIKGFCPVCGTKLCRIIGKAKPKEAEVGTPE